MTIKIKYHFYFYSLMISASMQNESDANKILVLRDLIFKMDKLICSQSNKYNEAKMKLILPRKNNFSLNHNIEQVSILPDPNNILYMENLLEDIIPKLSQIELERRGSMESSRDALHEIQLENMFLYNRLRKIKINKRKRECAMTPRRKVSESMSEL